MIKRFDRSVLLLAIMVFLILGRFQYTLAQDSTCVFSVSGSVSDADERTPLVGARILIKELGLFATTDEEGHYHFYRICSGTYTFLLSHEDCDTLTVRIKLESNLVRNFQLPHHFNVLTSVQVQSGISSQTQQVRGVLKGRDVEETRGRSLGEVLQRITGVSVLQTGSTIFKPVIHGLHSQRVILLNQEVRLEGQQWGSEHAPEIDPFIADRFIVLKGAGAIRYGSDAIGGAILVEPRPLMFDQRFRGEINTGYFTNNRQAVVNLQLEENLKQAPAFSWRTHVTFKRGGTARTPDYWLQNTGLQEFNFSGMAAYRKQDFRADLFLSSFSTDLGIFTGAHIGNLTDLLNTISSPRPLRNQDKFSYVIDRPRQRVQHYLGKFKASWSDETARKWQLVVAHQENNRSEFDRAMLTDRPELSLRIGTTSLDLNREVIRSQKRSSSLGVQGLFQQNVWSGSRFFIPNFSLWNVGLYAVEKWSLADWSAEGAIRADYRDFEVFRNRNGNTSTSRHRFFNPSGTLSLTRPLTDQFSLRWNTSYAWRAPYVNELYVNGLHHGTASFEIGDSSLRSERSLKNLLQAEYKKDSSLTLDLTIHVNRIDGFINLVPSAPPTLTLRGAYPTFRYIQTLALLTGTDFRFERYFSQHWSTLLKASLLWARDLRANDWLAQMPSHRFEAQATYTFDQRLLRNTYMSPSVVHVMRQNRVPVSGDYLPPPDAYTLLNIQFSTQLMVGKRPVQLQLGVTNALNTRYRDYMNRFRYFNDEVGRNFILQLKYAL